MILTMLNRPSYVAKIVYFPLVLGAIVSICAYAQAQSGVLTNKPYYKNLKLCDSAAVVNKLQQFLNQNHSPRLGSTGAGSPGNETNYFGPLTKNAVIRFQELYKNEVLTPIGLLRGTGYVGAMTRNKLNNVIVAQGAPQNPNTPISPQAQTPTLKKGDFEIKILPRSMAQTKPEDPPGTLVLVTDGEKAIDVLKAIVSSADVKKLIERPKMFDAMGNTVNFGTHTITGIPSDGRILYFNVPDMPPGEYAVSVTNSFGTSDEGLYTVTQKPQTLAAVTKIARIAPSVVKNGTTITIFGASFSLAENTIVTSFGKVSDVPSKDGKEISFTINSPFIETAQSYNLPFTVVMWVETGGQKSNKVSFVLTQ